MFKQPQLEPYTKEQEEFKAKCVLGEIPVHRGLYDPCWLMPLNGIGTNPYVLLWDKEKQETELAHHISYELFIGPLPKGIKYKDGGRKLDIDHLCKVKNCQNPWHFEIVTRSINVKRGITADRYTRNESCTKGHLFDDSNTYVTKAGKRHCKICAKNRYLQYKSEGRLSWQK